MTRLGRPHRLETWRRGVGWGAVLSAGFAVLMAASLAVSALMEGGWTAQNRQVLNAAMLLSATAGFLAVRLFAERARSGALGWRLAAWTLLFIVVLLAGVLAHGENHDGVTAMMLAIVAGVGAMMTASSTWLWRWPFLWLGLTPIDDRSQGRWKSLRELRELDAWILRNPRDSNALAERSKRLLERGEAARALDDLDKALQVDRKNAHHFLYLKHLVRLSQGDFSQALQDISSAIELDEIRRETYYVAAALAYVKCGRIDGVAAMLEKLGLPVSRVYAVQSSAFKAALSDIDREIATRTSMMAERYGSDERPRLDSLRQTRAEILAKLRKHPAAESY